MNIVYVSPRNPYIVGGVEYTIQKLAEGLVAKGHQVSVICGNSEIKKPKLELIKGIEILNVPTYAPKNNFHMTRDNASIENYLKKNIDIVHTHSAHALISNVPVKIKKEKNPNWKLIYSLHFSTPGYSPFKRFLWKVFWKNRINSSIKYVDAVHSTSELESNLITDMFCNAKNKLNLIPLGMDDDILGYEWTGHHSDYILYCGRLEKYKRITLALKAIEQVREQDYNIKFLIVGRGSRKSYFTKLTKKLPWVICTAPKSRQDYLELLKNARAVINLSSAENFNLFLAEACRIGVPIIATPTAAAFCPKFANVIELQPKKIANVIVNGINNPKICTFPKTCAPPSWSATVERFEKFYQEILNL